MATVVLSPVYVCVCVSICVKNVLAWHYTPARSLELPLTGFLFFRPAIPATPVNEKTYVGMCTLRRKGSIEP